MGRNSSIKRSAAAGASAGPPSFTVNPGDYKLLEKVGYGAHAVVYHAIFLPRNEVVAVKCLDLDQLNNSIVSTLVTSLILLQNSLVFGCGLVASATCCCCCCC
jgi:serine/threonine protein kinase